jgi:hypothetical protein
MSEAEGAGGPPGIRDDQGRFVPGVSGNPAGRPKAHRYLRDLLEPHLEEVAKVVIANAKTGEAQAVREFLDRLVGKATVGEPDENGREVSEVRYRWAEGEREG